MDLEKLNPCESEAYAKAMAWAETECWCCTATRAMLVAFVAGIAIGLFAAGEFVASAIFIVCAAPAVWGALVMARRIWKDAYKQTEGG
jgi:hypothetical protein